MKEKESYRRWECIRDTKEGNSLHWIQETDSKIEREGLYQRQETSLSITALKGTWFPSMRIPCSCHFFVTASSCHVTTSQFLVQQHFLIQDSCQSLTLGHFSKDFLLVGFFLCFIFSRQNLVLLTHDVCLGSLTFFYWIAGCNLFHDVSICISCWTRSVNNVNNMDTTILLSIKHEYDDFKTCYASVSNDSRFNISCIRNGGKEYVPQIFVSMTEFNR